MGDIARAFGDALRGTSALTSAQHAANALFAVELAKRLKRTNITVNFLRPGVVSTALARDMNGFIRCVARTFFITPEKGAQTSV